MLSAARPTHRDLASIRARTDADNTVTNFGAFRTSLEAVLGKYPKTGATNADISAWMTDLSGVFSQKYTLLGVSMGKLTPEQETALTNSVADSIKLTSDILYKTKDMKMYPSWTNMDAAMYGFYMNLAQCSYPALKAAMAKAGSQSAGQFHAMHMRNMVNLLGGSGYGY
ncbi:hypothetical protein RhiJN_06593 [Ceratobasidium sp. AG-Ba]|nr:hypothetical protein RhiJN_06593 [Ceratobasidium sp. AG-Ba]